MCKELTFIKAYHAAQTARKVNDRAQKKMWNAWKEYGNDPVCLTGPTQWSYGKGVQWYVASLDAICAAGKHRVRTFNYRGEAAACVMLSRKVGLMEVIIPPAAPIQEAQTTA